MDNSSSEVQSVVFEKKHWTLMQAKRWLREHKFKTDLDEKPETYRFRQTPPNYPKYRTKEVKRGILFVLGFKS